TDVGCAFRAMWASTYRLIRPRLRAPGPESFVEMLLETLHCRRRVLEIPVGFHLPRKGMRTGEQSVRTVLDIVMLIARRRCSPRGAGGRRAPRCRARVGGRSSPAVGASPSGLPAAGGGGAQDEPLPRQVRGRRARGLPGGAWPIKSPPIHFYLLAPLYRAAL